MENKNNSNVCGIVGLSTGWFCPVAGIVLGIVSLARKEPKTTLGVLSIIEGVAFWVIWAAVWSSNN
jgi:hypothetical protein